MEILSITKQQIAINFHQDEDWCRLFKCVHFIPQVVKFGSSHLLLIQHLYLLYVRWIPITHIPQFRNSPVSNVISSTIKWKLRDHKSQHKTHEFHSVLEQAQNPHQIHIPMKSFAKIIQVVFDYDFENKFFF